jgi:ParB family transcriptional regulator, chromosome partitioning protein
MGKLDDLKRMTSGNVDDSLGVGRVGRVLDAPGTSPATPARWQGVTKSKNAVEIPLEKIIPDPDQPREEFDQEALERLAQSLKTKGQLQPIRVRWDEGRGAYMILVGERRWRAAGLAGLATIAAAVVEGPIEPGELLAVQLIENCLREDLKPIEQAKAFKALIDRNGWTVRQVAQELAVNHSNVVRALALLELPESVQRFVEQGDLSPTTAYEVGKLADPAMQAEVAQATISEGLTRNEVVELVQAVKAKRPAPATRPEPATFDLGDGIVVTVKWKKASDVGPTQALRKALKLSQARENPEQAA